MRRWPGCAPGGAVTFFLSRQKESNQSKRRPRWPCPSAALRATCDARARGGAAELAARLRASLRQPQRVRARSAACCAAAPTPRPALLGTARGELEVRSGHRCARPWSCQAAASRGGFLAPTPAGGSGLGCGRTAARAWGRLRAPLLRKRGKARQRFRGVTFCSPPPPPPAPSCSPRAAPWPMPSARGPARRCRAGWGRW